MQENIIKRNLKEGEYYAVDYGDTYYIGRVEKISENKATCKFLSRQPGDKYIWPKRDDFDSLAFRPVCWFYQIKRHLSIHN
jgi:hypothetical protein